MNLEALSNEDVRRAYAAGKVSKGTAARELATRADFATSGDVDTYLGEATKKKETRTHFLHKKLW